MRHAYRMKIAGEMQVDVFHGHHLRITAPGRPALHAKTGSKRRLAQANHGFMAQAVQRIAQAHGRGGLAFARRRGANCGDEDQFAVGPCL